MAFEVNAHEDCPLGFNSFFLLASDVDAVVENVPDGNELIFIRLGFNYAT